MVMNNAHDVSVNYNTPTSKGVTLEPFLHQVGGHATMMYFNETTVCKPLKNREHFFYKSLPPDILQFTPQYKGVVNVNIEETDDGNIKLTAYPHDSDDDCESPIIQNTDDDGNIKLTAYPHDSDDDCESPSIIQNTDDPADAKNGTVPNEIPTSTNPVLPERFLPHSPCKRIRLKRTGSVYVEEPVDEEEDSSPDTNDSSSQTVNPWIRTVYKEGLKRHLRSSNKVSTDRLLRLHKYQQQGIDRRLARLECILLENVASKFSRPCVLDLKMGTRFHGDDDPEDKRQRLEMKCAASTTQKLGIRLGGMQIYKSSSGKYVCHDKYYGRNLDDVGLRSALRQFFHDGERIRSELLIPILKRLCSMRAILEKLSTFRFYSSSLLIMYDGDSSNFVECGSRDLLNQVEKTFATINKDQTGEVSNPKVAIEVDGRLSTSDQFLPGFDPCRDQCYLCDAACDVSTPSQESESEGSPPALAPSIDTESQMHVDIRMIDFAKSTHQNMDGWMVYDGPDQGYLFGLTNLINILKDILSSSSSFSS